MKMLNLWWGYLHINNTLKVKRFFDFIDIIDAEKSPFVKQIFRPFPAENHNDAVLIISEELAQASRKLLGLN